MAHYEDFGDIQLDLGLELDYLDKKDENKLASGDWKDKCTCDSWDLFNYGCRCGYKEREKRRKELEKELEKIREKDQEYPF